MNTQTHPYPEPAPRTVTEGFPLPLGVHPEHGTPMHVPVTGNILILGRTSSGSTTALHDVVAGLFQCQDVVLWCSAVNGGGALTHVHDQSGTDSPFDWFATSTSAARRMVRAARAVVMARREANRDDPFQVSDAHPALILAISDLAHAWPIVGAELIGFYEDLRLLMRIGPGYGVYVVLETKAGGTSLLDPGMIALFGARIVMRPDSLRAEELAYLLGSRVCDIDPDMIRTLCHRGQGVCRTSAYSGVYPILTYVADQETLIRVAAATAGGHPALEPEVARPLATYRNPIETGIDAITVEQRARREISSLALPVDATILASWIRTVSDEFMLAQARAGIPGDERKPMTSEYFELDPCTNRWCAYDQPAHR